MSDFTNTIIEIDDDGIPVSDGEGGTLKTYRWIVEFRVSSMWVQDGFNLTDERALAMLERDLPFANGSEIDALVLKGPDPKEITMEIGGK